MHRTRTRTLSADDRETLALLGITIPPGPESAAPARPSGRRGRSPRAHDAPSRDERLRALREAIQDGTYQVSAQLLAERIVRRVWAR